MTKVNLVAEPGKQEIVITRIFDAPRELVFKVCTDPTLIPQWWGPRRLTTTVDRMDVRPGGSWRFVHRAPDGSEYAFHGVYHAVVPPELVVNTFEFEGMPGHVVMETVTFEDHGGNETDGQVGLPVGRGSRRDAHVGDGARSGGELRASGRAPHGASISTSGRWTRGANRAPRGMLGGRRRGLVW